MAKMKLLPNDDIAILILDGVDYIAICPPDPQGPFILMPDNKTVEPEVELYTVKEEEDASIDASSWIRDANNTHHWSIISPRPRNIVRR